MKVSSQGPGVRYRDILKSWKGKLVQVETREQKGHNLGVLEGFDIYGVLLGPKKGLTNNMGFYEWKDITSIDYAKENNQLA